MLKYKWYIILLNLVSLAIYFAFSVVQKAEISDMRQLILLELAPVAQRSLIQGDYMTISLAITNEVQREKLTKRRKFVEEIEILGVAKFKPIQDNKPPLKTGEHLIIFT